MWVAALRRGRKDASMCQLYSKFWFHTGFSVVLRCECEVWCDTEALTTCAHWPFVRFGPALSAEIVSSSDDFVRNFWGTIIVNWHAYGCSALRCGFKVGAVVLTLSNVMIALQALIWFLSGFRCECKNRPASHGTMKNSSVTLSTHIGSTTNTPSTQNVSHQCAYGHVVHYCGTWSRSSGTHKVSPGWLSVLRRWLQLWERAPLDSSYFAQILPCYKLFRAAFSPKLPNVIIIKNNVLACKMFSMWAKTCN